MCAVLESVSAVLESVSAMLQSVCSQSVCSQSMQCCSESVQCWSQSAVSSALAAMTHLWHRHFLTASKDIAHTLVVVSVPLQSQYFTFLFTFLFSCPFWIGGPEALEQNNSFAQQNSQWFGRTKCKHRLVLWGWTPLLEREIER